MEKIIINDLVYSSYATLLYKSSRYYIPISLPSFVTKNAIKETVDLQNCYVVSKMNNPSSYIDMFVNDDEIDFDQKMNNIESVYLKNFNALFVLEGKHHAARCKINNGKGKICTQIIDIDPYINELESDRENWYYRGRAEKVLDFRIAILFFIYKKKLSLV